jgi:ATP-dependent DNA helicase UvrD/PcrA
VSQDGARLTYPLELFQNNRNFFPFVWLAWRRVGFAGRLRHEVVELERELNPQQRAAVLAPDGAALVLAGAGSGKTRVLSYRIAHLIGRGVNPAHILAVTFTNKAAREMRDRVERLLGGTGHSLWMGTFHAICARMLRMYGETIGVDRRFVILDDDDRLSLITRILRDLSVQDRLFAPRAIATHLDRAKNRGEGPDEYRAPDLLEEVVPRVYREYEQRLAESHALDFGDLLLRGLRLVTHPDTGERLRSRFQHVLVDEYQDTNRVQYLFARALAEGGSMFAVGDPDQSIYAFRGADIRNVLDFERDFAGAQIYRLEENYRSTPSILRVASTLIANNVARRAKDLFTNNPDEGLPILREADDERDEAEWIARTLRQLRGEGFRAGDAAIFYRTHAQSRALEEALRFSGFAYVMVGGMRFYERAEIKDAIAYLRVLVNPHDALDLRRIVNVPTRGIGDTTLDRVAQLAAERSLPLHEAMRVAAHAQDDLLKAGVRKKLLAFLQLMEELREAAAHEQPSRVLELVLEKSGYLERLAIEGTPEAQGRMENLQELLGSIRDYEKSTADASLDGFLERVALASEVDALGEDDGTVSLMTVHSAKGLEFPVVFVAGLEEDLFPHVRSTSDDAIEEERRLLYVALTRARRRLFLSHARQRRLFAQANIARPSRFLREIPRDLVTLQGGRSAAFDDEGASDQPWLDESESQVPTTWRQPKNRPPYASRGRSAAGYRAPRQESFAAAARPHDPRIGTRVKHPTFGAGIIRATVGDGNDAKLTIDFPQVGRKTVLARFVEPA